VPHGAFTVILRSPQCKGSGGSKTVILLKFPLLLAVR